MTTASIDPTRCPLCGDDNTCGVAAGTGQCWCFATSVPPEVLARVPEAQRDRACVCQRCASGERSAEEARERLARLTRDA